MSNSKNIAILGVWYGANYGSLFTYYSLFSYLKTHGYTPLMVDKNPYNKNDIELNPNFHARKFVNNHYQGFMIPPLLPEEMGVLNSKADTFILGSDQVLHRNCLSFTKNTFLCNFADDDKKLIAFSSSFGHEKDSNPVEARGEIGRLIRRFDYMGLREESGVNILRTNYNYFTAKTVVDAVFLNDKAFYEKLASESNREEKEEFILTYILDPKPEYKEFLTAISKHLGLKLVNILDGRTRLFEKNQEALGLPCEKDIEAQDFMYYFTKAKYIVTDSYHGTCFSVLLRKPFLTLANLKRGMVRFKMILGLTGLENRILHSADFDKAKHIFAEQINYDNVYKKLNPKINESKQFLENAISAPKIKDTDYNKVEFLKNGRFRDFVYEESYWEVNQNPSHSIVKLVAKKELSQPGHYVFLGVVPTFKKGVRYKLYIKTTINTKSNLVNFHIGNKEKKKFQLVYCLHTLLDTRAVKEFETVFQPNSNDYNSLMFGAAQFTGTDNFLELLDVVISEESPVKGVFNRTPLECVKSSRNKESFTKTVLNHLDIKNFCYGCGACSSSCPHNAIEMVRDDEGFFKPSINYDLCTNCGICEKKCPALHPVYSNDQKPECYAMMASNEIRMKSSSGGFFTLAAEYVLAKGGYVCGAVLNSDMTVEHILTNELIDLDRMRGSKYMQSNAFGCYPKIKELLNKGKLVLFTGCPCQVAGLRSFLNKQFDNLITIDLICHSVSSTKIFNKYYRDVLSGKPLSKYTFREKESYGWVPTINAYFADGSRYTKLGTKDYYYRAISPLSLICSRSCSDCQFAHVPRQGDLTIGDFWGIDKYNRAFNDRKGTSVVLINNNLGSKLYSEISKKCILSEKVPLQIAINGNPRISRTNKCDKNRVVFADNFYDLPFNVLTDACRANRVAEAQLLEIKKHVREEDLELYYIAKCVAKHCKNRKVVTWIRSSKFEAILKKFFGITVSFGVSMRKEALVAGSILDFEILKGASSQYYLVSLDRVYSPQVYQLLQDYGYTELKDFVFKVFKPIVLKGIDLAKSNYFDDYNNSVEGFSGVINQVIFRGFNNHILIGKNQDTSKNLNFDLSNNSFVDIGDGSKFIGESKIQLLTRSLKLQKVRIGKENRFNGKSLIKCFGNPYIYIGDSNAFNDNFEIHSNMAKRVIIGSDCMFSYDIELWAGDGHTVIDIKENRPLNQVASKLTSKDVLYIGNHVWIGKGAFLMAGSYIASGSVVGAKSVVKSKFPNNVSIGGNPATILKRDITWSRSDVAKTVSDCGDQSFVHLTSNTNSPITAKKVLVVGGKLGIGSPLVKELVALGNDVTVASRGKTLDTHGVYVNRLILDLSNEESCKKALSGKHFDVVFDDLSWGSEYTKNLVTYISCDKFIQLSSIDVYKLMMNIQENDFDPLKQEVTMVKHTENPELRRKSSEVYAYKHLKNADVITVRFSYSLPIFNFNYFCSHIVRKKPMNLPNLDTRISFTRVLDLVRFLPWLANQKFIGPINFGSSDSVSLKDIITYIENKTGIKAVLDTNAEELCPFATVNSYSLDMSKARNLGYDISNVNQWIWQDLDKEIAVALKSKGN